VSGSDMSAGEMSYTPWVTHPINGRPGPPVLQCWPVNCCMLIQVEHPASDIEQQWRKAVSLQRKRAVMACFRMIPVYNLSRSAASFYLLLCCKF